MFAPLNCPDFGREQLPEDLENFGGIDRRKGGDDPFALDVDGDKVLLAPPLAVVMEPVVGEVRRETPLVPHIQARLQGYFLHLGEHYGA